MRHHDQLGGGVGKSRWLLKAILMVGSVVRLSAQVETSDAGPLSPALAPGTPATEFARLIWPTLIV
jgi:hypothetical protein